MNGGEPSGPRLALLVGTASGGTARHVAALAAGCARAGMDVSALGPEQARGLFAAGITFSSVQIGASPHPLRDGRAVMALRRQLRVIGPDVVHAHGVRAGAFAALALAGVRPGSRPALVVTVHNAPPAGRINEAVYAVLERVCARRADVVLCASPDLVTRMRGLGAAGAQQFDVPAEAGVVPSAAAVAKVAADIGNGRRPVVLAVGRLAPQKGFDVLVAAAARWAGDPAAPLTVIAGDGPLAAQLSAQASRAGADVVLLGERDDVPALLAVADVFVLPSRWEARALALQEAMQAGRAIVATSAGGTPGLTGPDAALLVPPDDDAALAEAVLRVLGETELRASLGAAARARAGTLPTQDDAVRQARAIYADLVARHGAD